MKTLNGKELMRGDVVLHSTPDGVIAGAIHEFYDRSNQVRISGYPLRVPAADTVLAADAYKAIVGTLPPDPVAPPTDSTPPEAPIVPPATPEAPSTVV